MKKTKTMKQKKNNIGFFQTCLLQDFQDIVSKKITDNRKQKTDFGKQKTEKKHPRKKQTRSIEAICAFPNWIFICLHVIRVSF